MYVVQKNIPIPAPIAGPRAAGRRKYPFEQLDVGDMFFVPNRAKNRLTTHASTVGKQLGRSFRTRLLYMVDNGGAWAPATKDTPDAVLGIGVWREE
jgi:hypothetical protein